MYWFYNDVCFFSNWCLSSLFRTVKIFFNSIFSDSKVNQVKSENFPVVFKSAVSRINFVNKNRQGKEKNILNIIKYTYTTYLGILYLERILWGTLLGFIVRGLGVWSEFYWSCCFETLGFNNFWNFTFDLQSDHKNSMLNIFV